MKGWYLHHVGRPTEADLYIVKAKLALLPLVAILILTYNRGEVFNPLGVSLEAQT